MRTFIHNIRTVARYEAVTLRRSWFFRLFAIGSIFIFTFLNIGLFSPVGDESWELVSIPSSVPLINLYLLNIVQSIVVIFLAADFLKRDKKIDTNEVLYTRPVSNFEYITGKTLGILKLFIGLDIIVLLIALLINIISKNMTVDLFSYLEYLFIICIPTIIFSLGLAFILMHIIGNQAITYLLLLGIAALNMFWLYYRLGSLFDYMAFGLPVFKSGIIGFDRPELIINQRLLYLLLGLSLILATVLTFKRLPQSKLQTALCYILLTILLTGTIICAVNTFSLYRNDKHDRQAVIETNRQFEAYEAVTVTDADIEISHSANNIQAKARLSFINENKSGLGDYFFSLNPGLKVSAVFHNGEEINFSSVNHVFLVQPQEMLQPGQKDSLTITYAGDINEAFCYPNYTGNIKDNPYMIEMLRVNKRQAFLTERFVLLTPETHWYPVAGLNYYPDNPARMKIDFTNFSLRVKTASGLTPVSQGIMNKESDTFTFSPESPLTGMTLVIGNYLSDTLTVDSIAYITHYFPDNNYYRSEFNELADTLPLMVSGMMTELETNFSTKYPFRSLNFIEVPVQFYSYPKMSTQTRAELQPSMVLIPERMATIRNAGFRKQISRQKRRMTRSNTVITDKELQVRIFNDFIRNTFISGENFRFVNGIAVNEPVRYRLSPSFYFFKNNFYSNEYPVINATFESHLQKVISPFPTGFQGTDRVLTDNDQANLILSSYSLKELLSLNPASDTLQKVLTVKGDYLFNLFRAKVGIEEFNDWFEKYLDEKRFKRVSIEQLNDDMNKRFGFEFYSYLDNWFMNKTLPGFIINNLQVSEIVTDNRVRYQVTFVSSNPEPVAGLFNVSFRTGAAGPQGGPGVGGPMMMQGGGRGNFAISRQGRGMEAADISKIVFIDSCEARKIGIVLDAEPRAMMVNTLFSKNIPGQLIIPVNDIGRIKDGVKPFTGEERLQAIPAYTNPDEIIIDNEDPLFSISRQIDKSPLKKLLKITNNQGNTYLQINNMYAPEHWQPVVQSSYFGRYILSAVHTRAGSGNREATWNAVIRDPGYYNVYFYVGKAVERTSVRNSGAGPGRGGPRGGMPPGGTPGDVPGDRGQGAFAGGPGVEPPIQNLHLKIYHDEGIEEMTFDYQTAEGGWNYLGRYYLSSDTAKVKISNLSNGKMVIADAIKWVKENQ